MIDDIPEDEFDIPDELQYIITTSENSLNLFNQDPSEMENYIELDSVTQAEDLQSIILAILFIIPSLAISKYTLHIYKRRYAYISEYCFIYRSWKSTIFREIRKRTKRIFKVGAINESDGKSRKSFDSEEDVLFNRDKSAESIFNKLDTRVKTQEK